MKSIIQEASSIAKAIEEGWTKAQKPQQFSVKVLEEAEKNFLGLTKKSAKVAIFFEEPQLNRPTTTPAQRSAQKPTRPQTQAPHARQQNQPNMARNASQQPARQNQHNHAAHMPKQEPLVAAEKPVKKQFEPLWTQPMVDLTHKWMTEALKNSQNEHIHFTVEPQKFHMRITLSTPILPDPDKEKQLLASFSSLILETLKRTFKLSLRGHKIVLTHQPR